jgi:hypothetical protein
MLSVFEELLHRVVPCGKHGEVDHLCRLIGWASADEDKWYRVCALDRYIAWRPRLQKNDTPCAQIVIRTNQYNIERSIFPLFALRQLLPHEVTMIIIVLSFWGAEEEPTSAKD